ncbi:MAG: MBL fold metallo-hydrolase [Aigarchaeota archaeon]|nr:MBL fold metallo-hydrolase [Candidatus Pelearchaeum maunauluense]
MKIDYIAFDSFGVKSSCVKVETGDATITIDPGIAWEVDSFSLTEREKAALDRRYTAEIKRACGESDIIALTHHHYDHHIPERSLYVGKRLFVKDLRRWINASQRGRAYELLEGLDAKIEVADNKTFRIGGTKIWFSKPLWHGVKGTSLGHVVMVGIDDGGTRILHTSDIDGPILEEPIKLIQRYNPDILIIDGPPTYILGYMHSYYNLARSVINLCRIIESIDAELIILDHHPLRDYRYRVLLYEAYRHAERYGKTMETAAEYEAEGNRGL